MSNDRRLPEPRPEAQPFTAAIFTPTQWNTAEDKAKFANHFVAFVTGGCKQGLFHKWFYTRLSNAFGHIAHYDASGFWGVWCSTPQGRYQFLQNTLNWHPVGDPKFTYSDVEAAVQKWLRASGLVAQFQREAEADTEAAEREQLRSLLAKYPDEVPHE